MTKSQTEKKVLKHLAKFGALEAELQLIYPPKVFAAIEALALAHLKSEKYSPHARESVSKLAFLMRQETFSRFGHETLETIALSKLLKPTSIHWKPPPPRLDSISFMRTYPINRRMNTNHEAAAEMIKKVWEAFGRFRFIGGRNLESAGMGGGGQAMQPLDVMGDDLWKHYKNHYIPWYKRVAMLTVDRRRYQPGMLSLAAIVFKVLVEDFYPEEVDSGYGLVHGTAYRCLKVALEGYYEPQALDTFAAEKKAREDARLKPAAPKRA